MGILGKCLLNADVRQFVVTLDQKDSVSSLKRNRKALEEMFYLDCAGFAPSSRFLSRDLLEKDDGFQIPAIERFNDEWLKEDAFSSANVKVRMVLCSLPRFDGGGRCVGCSMKQRLLRRGNDANVKGDLSNV